MSAEEAKLWNGVQRAAKERLAQSRVEGSEEINKIGEEIAVEWITPYQARVGGTIDLFPTRRKFHHIPTNTRGMYAGGNWAPEVFASARAVVDHFFALEDMKATGLSVPQEIYIKGRTVRCSCGGDGQEAVVYDKKTKEEIEIIGRRCFSCGKHQEIDQEAFTQKYHNETV